MHTWISSHRFKRSWHSYNRWVNAGNKNTPSMHHPWRWNVTTSVVGLKNVHIRKNLTQSGEPQRYNSECRKRKTRRRSLKTMAHTSKNRHCLLDKLVLVLTEFTDNLYNNNNNNNRTERRNSRFLQSPHCATNCLQHIRSSGPGAILCKLRSTNRALIMCNLKCATLYEGTAQLISLTE